MQTTETIAPEARSGLDAWKIAELPPAPRPQGLGWFSAIGPGVIALGVSIGSGEFLLGPAAFVKYGLSLLWVVGVAALLQTLLNVELMRYTMATGEPIFTGFMRVRPHSTFWAWFYSILYFLQMGWPGWAGAAGHCRTCLLPGNGKCKLSKAPLGRVNSRHAVAGNLPDGNWRRSSSPSGSLCGLGRFDRPARARPLYECCPLEGALRNGHRRDAARFPRGGDCLF